MDQSARKEAQPCLAMQPSRTAAFELVLQATGGPFRGYPSDESDRREIHEDAILREPSDDRSSESFGSCAQSQKGSTADAHHGNSGGGAWSEHKPPPHRAPRVSLSLERALHRATQSGVGSGHHLHSIAPRICVSGGHHGLVQPIRVVMEAFEQPGNCLLLGITGRGVDGGQSRDFQYGPGVPVYERGIYEQAEGTRDKNQHGFERSGLRQHFCGKALAEREIRRCLSQRVSNDEGGPRGAWALFPFLQSRAISSVVEKSDSAGNIYEQERGGFSREHRKSDSKTGPKNKQVSLK